jgi:HEAT repeat protein
MMGFFDWLKRATQISKRSTSNPTNRGGTQSEPSKSRIQQTGSFVAGKEIPSSANMVEPTSGDPYGLGQRLNSIFDSCPHIGAFVEAYAQEMKERYGDDSFLYSDNARGDILKKFIDHLKGEQDKDTLSKAFEYGKANPDKTPAALYAHRLAAEALADLGAVKPLVDVFKNAPAISTKENAASGLMKLGDSLAVEPVLEMFKNTELPDRVRDLAGRVLGEIGNPDVVEPCTEILEADASRYVRDSAALVLGEVGYVNALEPLLDVLADRSEDWMHDQHRNRAALALGKLKDPRAIGPLLDSFLRKDGSRVSRDAIMALEMIGTEEAARALLAAFEGASHDLINISSALSHLKHPQTVEPLIGILRHHSAAEKTKYAAETLGWIGDPRAIDVLVDTAKSDGSDDVRGAAIESVIKMRNHVTNYAELLIGALKGDKDPWVRLKAAKALGDSGDLRAVGPLMEALKDKNWRFRDTATEAIIKIGDQRVSTELRKAIEEDPGLKPNFNEEVRRNWEAFFSTEEPHIVRPKVLVIKFRPQCLRCYASLKEIETASTIAAEGGEIVCSKCREVYDYSASPTKLTLRIRAIPVGYSGPNEKVFDPIKD